jgi:hypothetical protein
MKLKTLLITIAVLAVLSVVAFIARRPEAPPSADARVNQPLLAEATAEQVAKIRITDQGKTVSLDRQADGTWQVTSYHNLPADFQKLSTFVGSLTDAKLQRLVTSNAERIARLEFKDTKIELQDAAGKELATVTLGKHADMGGGRFVRFGNEQKAYLTNLNAWLDSESRNWASPELLTLKPDDIAKVELTVPETSAPVVLTRPKKEDPWTASPTPEGRKLRADKVASVVSSLTSLRFTDTNDRTDTNAVAAKANLQTVKLTTFDNKTVTVALGRKPEEKKLKPPSPGADGKSGPGSLGSVSDLTKKDSPSDNKPLAPEFETIPAGPVFAFVTHSDANAPVNAWMEKRAFQVAEYVFTGLPQKLDDLFEAAAAPTPAPAPAPAPAAEKKE